jgi:6-phosphogluconolactonase (cycloisomerase 2 family)
MVMDATSSWLIFTSVGSSNQISALQVDPTTGLPVSGNPSTTIALNNGTPQSLAISPSNTEVFLALGSAGVQSFSFAPTASSPLAATASIPVHTANFTANAVAVDTTSTYLFIAEAAPIPTTGTPNVPGVLRELTISSLGSDLTDSATGVSPSAVLPDASGLYVYVTNQADDTISGYTLKPSAGALPPIGSSPYPTCKGPVALAEDSSKSYLVDVGIGNNPDLYLYSFDQTTLDGTLDVGTTVSTGTVNPSLAYSVAITH